MTVANRDDFVASCREAMTAVLDAIGAVGQDRLNLLTDAKLAVDRALHTAHSSEQWCLADHLRRGIKDVEARAQSAA